MRTDGQIASLDHVSKSYGFNGSTTTALNDISLEVNSGELVLLLGPSGSGKTTLLSLLAGLLEPTTGDVRLFGRRVSAYTGRALQKVRAQRIGFVFQNFLLLEALTVRQNIELVRSFATAEEGKTGRSTDDLLRQMSIGHRADMYPGRISQGEKQRAAIARALVNDADLLLADEPTASLESSQGAEIIRLLHGLAKEENRGVVVASHDLRLVDFADRVLRLVDGSLVQEG